jgi:Uma2 family endonuclease
LKGFVVVGDRGTVVWSPYKLRIREGKFREPDLLFVLADHRNWLGLRYADGADLVMEVVSEENRRHDLETKRREYAEAGIPEYWIVDPQAGRITVLSLPASGSGPVAGSGSSSPASLQYEEHGVFGVGERAASRPLPGFEVDVSAAFARSF